MDYAKLLSRFNTFFDEDAKALLIKAVSNNNVLVIDSEMLEKFDSELFDYFLDNPTECFDVIKTVLDTFALSEDKISFRLSNLPDTYKVKINALRSAHLNKFMGIDGVIKQVSEVRPEVNYTVWECNSCGEKQSIIVDTPLLEKPYSCECGNTKSFVLLSKRMIDVQKIVLEEPQDNLDSGKQARKIDIFLSGDLVDPTFQKSIIPGNRVKLSGVLLDKPLKMERGRESARRDIFLECNYIENTEQDLDDLELTDDEITEIKTIASSPDIYDNLVKSIAPSIFGYDKEKLSIGLQLFSGVQKVRADGMKTRGDIHILLVGDPGAAKSQMLKYVCDLSPKGRYVVGKSTSGAGLTAAAVKDEFTGSWALEAGVLVLANGGLVAIDEMDKMDTNDRSAMHEAMEQQCMLPNFKLMLSTGKEVEIGPFVDNLFEEHSEDIYNGKDCQILPINSIELLSTDFNTHFKNNTNRISRHIAPKSFINVKLANGKDITVTPEHPCWVVNNGVIKTLSAEKLTTNMYFPIPSRIDIHQKPYDANNDILCKLLGYHISDGCYELNRGKKIGIQFSNKDKDLIADYKQSIELYFNKKPIITTNKDILSVRVISIDIARRFNEMSGNLLEKKIIRQVPEEIMEYPNKNIKHLLKALYDGDGSISLQKRNNCRISYVSQNKRLIEQISNLLLRFEIQSTMYFDKSSNIYRLSISGQDNLNNFLNNIGFMSKKKQLQLEQYCNTKKTYRTITDIIPNCSDVINYIFTQLDINQKTVLGHKIDLGVEKQRVFLQKLINIAEDKVTINVNTIPNYIKNNKRLLECIHNLQLLAFGYARWSKIKSVSVVTNEDIKWVYDVTIEPYHTFISNGMILHNTITINKASIQATLNARTIILAAANPKYGRFDPFQSIPEQINLPDTLISRFDLIFPIRDIPDKKKDMDISGHILNLHKNPKIQEVPITQQMIRKYISYARNHCNPVLTDEAIKKIQHFYVKIRNQKSDEENPPVPLTARQLEALVRLSEASARIRLSPTVDSSDADRAIMLLKYCLSKVGIDPETGIMDIDVMTSGVSKKKRNVLVLVSNKISELCSKADNGMAQVDDIIDSLETTDLDRHKIESVVEALKRDGELFEPRAGYYRKVSR